MNNLLFAESLIVDRLKNFAPLAMMVRSVDSMTDFESVAQRSQTLPALFVTYAGEKIDATYDDGKTHMVMQKWGVVIAVSTAVQSDVLAGAGVRYQAGEIMAEISNALCGVCLTDDVSALYQIDSPMPVYKTGRGYFFMMFGLNMARQFGD